jgi:hypothetical protein
MTPPCAKRRRRAGRSGGRRTAAVVTVGRQSVRRGAALPRPDGGPRGPGAGSAELGTPPAIGAGGPCTEDRPQAHGAEPMDVQDRPRARSGGAGPTAPAAGARRRKQQSRRRSVRIRGALPRPDSGPRGHGAGPAEVGAPPAIRAHGPGMEDSPQEHGAEPVEVKIAHWRKAAAPGRPLRRPAHGGGDDSRVGEVVVFGAHCPARTAARVGPAPGQRKVARLRRTGRTALVQRTARRSTAMSRWRYKNAPGREAAAPGRPHRRQAPAAGETVASAKSS